MAPSSSSPPPPISSSPVPPHQASSHPHHPHNLNISELQQKLSALSVSMETESAAAAEDGNLSSAAAAGGIHSSSQTLQQQNNDTWNNSRHHTTNNKTDSNSSVPSFPEMMLQEQQNSNYRRGKKTNKRKRMLSLQQQQQQQQKKNHHHQQQQSRFNRRNSIGAAAADAISHAKNQNPKRGNATTTTTTNRNNTSNKLRYPSHLQKSGAAAVNRVAGANNQPIQLPSESDSKAIAPSSNSHLPTEQESTSLRNPNDEASPSHLNDETLETITSQPTTNHPYANHIKNILSQMEESSVDREVLLSELNEWVEQRMRHQEEANRSQPDEETTSRQDQDNLPNYKPLNSSLPARHDEDKSPINSSRKSITASDLSTTDAQYKHLLAPSSSNETLAADGDSATLSTILREESIEDLDGERIASDGSSEDSDFHEKPLERPSSSGHPSYRSVERSRTDSMQESSLRDDSSTDSSSSIESSSTSTVSRTSTQSSNQIVPSPIHQELFGNQFSQQSGGRLKLQQKGSSSPLSSSSSSITVQQQQQQHMNYSPLSGSTPKARSSNLAERRNWNADRNLSDAYSGESLNTPRDRAASNEQLASRSSSDVLRLEMEMRSLRQENATIGQNYMRAMEQNEELLQDVDILSEKYRHVTQRMQILEKIITQNQQETEKKDQSLQKRMRYMSQQVNEAHRERDSLKSSLTSKLDHANSQIQEKDKQILSHEHEMEKQESRVANLKQHIEQLQGEVNTQRKEIFSLQEVNRSQLSEIQRSTREKEALNDEQQRLLAVIDSLKQDKKQLNDALTEKQDQVHALEEKIPKEPYTLRSNMTDMETQTPSGATVEEKLAFKQEVERKLAAYMNQSRTACTEVRRSHDEFVAQILHEVKNQILDTATAFINHFGARNKVDILIIDRWIKKFEKKYTQHVSNVEYLTDQQYDLYKGRFNQEEMTDARQELIHLSHRALFEWMHNGVREERDNQQVTSTLYHNLKQQMDSLSRANTDLEEENAMLKTQLKVMEATQGKLSNVAEMERQLKRAQIKMETLEEDSREYRDRCEELEIQLENLRESLKAEGIVKLTEDPPFADEGDETDVDTQLSDDSNRITQFQLYEDGKLVSTPRGVVSQRKRRSSVSSETPQDRLLKETKLFASSSSFAKKKTGTVEISNSNSHLSKTPDSSGFFNGFEYDANDYDMHIKLERAMVEAKTQKQYAKFSRIHRKLKTQINEVYHSVRLLLEKVTEHEAKKIENSESEKDSQKTANKQGGNKSQQSTDSTSPEWLKKLLAERSNDLMRATERLITRYSRTIEITEKKVEEFIHEPITLFKSPQEKITEEDLFKFKDSYELQFLKLTEHALQQYLDTMMTEACQKYPLRAVDEEDVGNRVREFLSQQLPVVSELLSVVLNKMLTLHHSCTDYIDRLLEELEYTRGLVNSGQISSGSPAHLRMGLQSRGAPASSQQTRPGARNLPPTPSSNLLSFIQPTPSQEPEVQLNRSQQQRMEQISRRKSLLSPRAAPNDLNESASDLVNSGRSEFAPFSLYSQSETLDGVDWNSLDSNTQSAYRLLNRSNILKSQRVAARFRCWIAEKKLMSLQAEIYAVQAGTGDVENSVLVRNLQFMLTYQKGKCERLRNRFAALDQRYTRTIQQSMQALQQYVQLGVQNSMTKNESVNFSYFDVNSTVDQKSPLAESKHQYTGPSSANALHSSMMNHFIRSKKPSTAAARLKPMRDKSLFSRPNKTSHEARRRSSNPSLIEERASNFSIFRKKTTDSSSGGKKISSTRNENSNTFPNVYSRGEKVSRSQVSSNSAKVRHFTPGTKAPKKIPAPGRKLTSAPSLHQDRRRHLPKV